MLEQRPHVTRPGSRVACRAVERRRRSATGRPGAEPDSSRVLVIKGNAAAAVRERGLLFPFTTGADHVVERPAGPAHEDRHRTLGGELGLAPVADTQPDAFRDPGLAFVERLGHATLAQSAGVRLTFLGGWALEPGLPAFSFARDPGIDLGLRGLQPGCLIRHGVRGLVDRRSSHVNHPLAGDRKHFPALIGATSVRLRATAGHGASGPVQPPERSNQVVLSCV